MKATFFFLLLLLAYPSFSQIFYLEEDFNSGQLPNGWSNTAISGTENWKFGLDGSNAVSPFAGDPGQNNIDGSIMAIFDDDSLGNSHRNNTVELKSKIIDLSKSVEPILSFDYNFRSIKPVAAGVNDSFYVEVYDGSNWQLAIDLFH